MVIRPPIAPLLLGDDRYIATAWVSYFQTLADHIGKLEAVITALAAVHANDAAAHAAGIAVGSPYWNGTAVVVRVV